MKSDKAAARKARAKKLPTTPVTLEQSKRPRCECAIPALSKNVSNLCTTCGKLR